MFDFKRDEEDYGFKPPEQVDCDYLGEKSLTLTIDGRDLKNIVNGLYALRQINKMAVKADFDGVCDDCSEATESLYKKLNDELRSME